MSKKRTYSASTIPDHDHTTLTFHDRCSVSPPASKRARIARSRFDSLSDELVLKVLSYLTPFELTRCQQVCHRFFRTAGDDQLWKAVFYERFVRPRTSMLPGSVRPGMQLAMRAYNSRPVKWSEEEGLANTQSTNWKRLYKLRHNWNRGTCGVTEIVFSAVPTEPPLSFQLRRGIIFTIDVCKGLQAWRVEGEKNLIASTSLETMDLKKSEGFSPRLGLPTALAVDENENYNAEEHINIAVGFETGSFVLYQLDFRTSAIRPRYTHCTSGTPVKLTAMALSQSHLITLNDKQTFTIYHFGSQMEFGLDNIHSPSPKPIKSPAVVATLKAHTVWPPVNLSIRQSTHGIFACVVYSIPTFNLGWSVGIQEIHLGSDGISVQKSRIATAVLHGFHPEILQSSAENASSTASLPINSLSLKGQDLLSQAPLSQPTSLSYAHPYLLTAHDDNTLTLYLVKSTNTSLEITAGQRLWGHTSAVSGAHVGSRGRAVSVSLRGSELRVWALEGSVPGNRRGKESVKVHPSPHRTSNLSSHSLSTRSHSTSPTHTSWLDNAAQDRWLGFDDEKVIVHREKETGSQVFMVYDFS
ncbi:hypothetical protein BDZ91DRAFT_680011 [Kalaharituber pfeilii]|nr:hypothetical protein BDZ91DRAFT_680011 [Kalaharituber pfeilii]